MLLLGDQGRKRPRAGHDVVAQTYGRFGRVALLGSADGHDELGAVVVQGGDHRGGGDDVAGDGDHEHRGGECGIVDDS